MVENPMFDVFLAHNSADKPQVKAIAKELRARGLNPWLDEEQLAPGELCHEAIQRVIPQIKSAAICIGPTGLGNWERLELPVLISQFVNKGSPVIPLLLPGVDSIPENLPFLSQFNWVIFRRIDDANAFDLLQWGITRIKPNERGQEDYTFDDCQKEIARIYNSDREVQGAEFLVSLLAEVWFKQSQLIELLTPCDWKWLKRAYDHCRPRDWNSKQPENLVEVVTDLYGYYEKNKKNDENILINFVVYLIAQPELSKSLEGKLKKWAKRAFDVTEEEIDQKCDRLKESLAAKQVPGEKSIESRLWIILNEAGTTDQYKLESAYYIKNSYQKIEVELLENIKRSQLQDKNFCFPGLTEIIDQIYVDETLRVEFFLPFKSLDLMADSWLIEDEYGEEPFPVGSEYPVVIRVLERHNKIYKRAPLWEGNWQPQYINQLSRRALICSDRPPEEISEELTREEILGVRCNCPIETHANKPKALIMRRGLPIALWLRQELKNCCGEEKYQELLDINLVELPQKLKNIRNADRQNELHLAHHISLLWDEPTKLPSDDYNFQMPKSKS